MLTADTEILDPLLNYLWAVKATDLHLSGGSSPRIRVDGKLVAISDMAPVEDAVLLAAIDALLPEADRAEYRRERQLDFAFGWADTARFRANAYFQMERPSLALRLIPSVIPTPESLGLPAATAKLVTRPHGLVLVTGPTGSGKSTTLAAMIGWINQNRPCHILTIEDPVEYLHTSSLALVNQREVGPDVPTFALGLRAALREDPDVVLVGEMRDLETIALTLTLAETGHLVFATLHTNDASQTIDRVIDVFPPDSQDQVRTQLSMSLAGVVSQRLIPRIGGGRVAAYEILMATSAVSNLIREGKIRQLRNILATGSSEGMCVLEQSLSERVVSGTITAADARAVSVYPEEIAEAPAAPPMPASVLT